MIVDCFPYNGERDVLDIRLNTLAGAVDKFVLVEAELTQSLKPKPLHFRDQRALFAPFLDRIVHIEVKASECPDNDLNPWAMENFTRDRISSGFQSIPELADEDVVLISDCDEIPEPNTLKKVCLRPDGSIRLDSPTSFEGYFGAYFLNLHAPAKTWVGTVALPRWMLGKLTPQQVRNNKDFYDRVEDSLWHFSYCRGSWRSVWEKYLAAIEPINKMVLLDKEAGFKDFFFQRVVRDKTFIYIDRPWDRSIKLEELASEKLPKCVRENPGRYQNLLWKEGMEIN